MGAILKLVPLKDWIYLAIIVVAGLAFWGYSVHERKVGAAHEVEAVTKASDRTKADAQKVLDAKTDDYKLKLKASQEKRDEDVNAAAAHAADLGDRLRHYEALNRANAGVPGAATPGTPAAACSGSDSEVVIPRPVFEALIGVEAAAEHDHAIIISERAERDALTGK